MRNALQLGDSINTYDPALALRDETGTFMVITPSGDELYITCKPGHSIVSLQWGVGKQPFLVTKISEPVTVEGRPSVISDTRLNRAAVAG